MPVLVCDSSEAQALIKHRQETGGDRYDEVWDEVYVMSPLANPEHQHIIAQLVSILMVVVDDVGLGRVYLGANVTDRTDNWEKNYRCPDVVVVLKESEARCSDIGPALLGGPDFLIEVRSPDDKTFEKLDFYASIGVRELLIIDRDTKAIRSYQLQAGRLIEMSAKDGCFISHVVNLSFRPQPGGKIAIKTINGLERHWQI